MIRDFIAGTLGTILMLLFDLAGLALIIIGLIGLSENMLAGVFYIVGGILLICFGFGVRHALGRIVHMR